MNLQSPFQLVWPHCSLAGSADGPVQYVYTCTHTPANVGSRGDERVCYLGFLVSVLHIFGVFPPLTHFIQLIIFLKPKNISNIQNKCMYIGQSLHWKYDANDKNG